MGPKVACRAPEYNVPYFFTDWAGRLFLLLIGPENTNFVEDLKIFLPVKFRWMLFSSFRGDVKNVLANQRLWHPSCFSIGPIEKHKLGRERWDLASCQVPLNTVQWFQMRIRKYLSQSEAGRPFCGRTMGSKVTCRPPEYNVPFFWRIGQGGYFGSAQNTETWKRTFRSCFLSSFVEFRTAVPNVSANQNPVGHLLFPIGKKPHKLCRGRWDLASCQVSLNYVQRF